MLLIKKKKLLSKEVDGIYLPHAHSFVNLILSFRCTTGITLYYYMRISSFPLWDLQIGKQFLVGLMQEWKSKVKSTQSYVDEFSKKYRDYRLQGKLDYKINWKETDLKSVLFWPLDNMGRARLRSHEILTLCYLVLFLNTFVWAGNVAQWWTTYLLHMCKTLTVTLSTAKEEKQERERRRQPKKNTTKCPSSKELKRWNLQA